MGKGGWGLQILRPTFSSYFSGSAQGPEAKHTSCPLCIPCLDIDHTFSCLSMCSNQSASLLSLYGWSGCPVPRQWYSEPTLAVPAVEDWPQWADAVGQSWNCWEIWTSQKRRYESNHQPKKPHQAPQILHKLMFFPCRKHPHNLAEVSSFVSQQDMRAINSWRTCAFGSKPTDFGISSGKYCLFIWYFPKNNGKTLENRKNWKHMEKIVFSIGFCMFL